MRHDNELVVVLTGHLLIEELLVAAVEKNVPRPEKLNSRSFYDHLCLARAIARPELSDDVLDEVEALNRLRNQLAHNLDEQEYKERRSEFLSYCKEPCSDILHSEFGEMWVAIMRLHSRLIFAVEFDPASLRLPSLLSMSSGKAERAHEQSKDKEPEPNPSLTLKLQSGGARNETGR